jgi:UDP-glucuronate decarboxylase
MNVPGDVDGPVNLGNQNERTILEVAALVISLAGSRSQIEYRPLPQDDPRQRCPDITRAQQLLHWQPKVSLEEGLQRTIAYFDHLLASDREPVRKLEWKVAL